MLLREMAPSDDQPTAQDSISLSDMSGKRKRESNEEGTKTARTTTKKSRKSLKTNAKEKPSEETGKYSLAWTLE